MLLRIGGYPAQAVLWSLLTAGRLELHDFSTNEVDRMAGMTNVEIRMTKE
ncbi:MAG: hypothetical protein IID44_14760 [Planctomycetes bacterium]|nr:hypothetical protein [Planctomycetota bacterium]